MNGMERIVGVTDGWTTDLVAPLHSLLRGLSKYSNNRIYSFTQRIRDVCRLNVEFASCVNRCGDRAAARILLKGQTSWTSICDAYHYNNGDFMSFVVPCWSRYGDDVAELCTTQATVLQHAASSLVDSGIQMINEHLIDLCSSVTMYDKCYARQSNKFCGPKMHEFVTDLSQRSFRALLELLQESGLIEHLPQTCEHWASKPSNYEWHNERGSAQRRDISASCSGYHGNAAAFLVLVIAAVVQR